MYENSVYQFRVCAENAAGAGPFSVPTDPTPCEDPIGIPAVPSNLRVGDSTKTSVTLTWDAPWYDGGDRKVSYIVEVESDDGDWTKCCEKKTDEFECCVDSLEDGRAYNFRVKTVNRAGESKPVPIQATARERIGNDLISQLCEYFVIDCGFSVAVTM